MEVEPQGERLFGYHDESPKLPAGPAPLAQDAQQIPVLEADDGSNFHAGSLLASEYVVISMAQAQYAQSGADTTGQSSARHVHAAW